MKTKHSLLFAGLVIFSVVELVDPTGDTSVIETAQDELSRKIEAEDKEPTEPVPPNSASVYQSDIQDTFDEEGGNPDDLGEVDPEEYDEELTLTEP